jgi:hypothetical protein
MSSFARIYGVKKVMSDPTFSSAASQWCEEHGDVCDIELESLSKVDVYFKKIYEEL